MTLTKHWKAEHFALGHYLSEWPANWSYEEVIDELEHGNESEEVWIAEKYEDDMPQEIAVLINSMKQDILRLIGS
jgi:hypothetical protein